MVSCYANDVYQLLVNVSLVVWLLAHFGRESQRFQTSAKLDHDAMKNKALLFGATILSSPNRGHPINVLRSVVVFLLVGPILLTALGS